MPVVWCLLWYNGAWCLLCGACGIMVCGACCVVLVVWCLLCGACCVVLVVV